MPNGKLSLRRFVDPTTGWIVEKVLDKAVDLVLYPLLIAMLATLYIAVNLIRGNPVYRDRAVTVLVTSIGIAALMFTGRVIANRLRRRPAPEEESSDSPSVVDATAYSTTNIDYLREEWRDIDDPLETEPYGTAQVKALLLSFQNKPLRTHAIKSARYVTASIEYWKIRDGEFPDKSHPLEGVIPTAHEEVINAGWQRNIRLTTVSFEPQSVRDLILVFQRGGKFYALEDMREDRPYQPIRVAKLSDGVWRVIIRFAIDGQLDSRRHNFKLFVFQGEQPAITPMKEDYELMCPTDH
jgi:hypothetical protein